MSAVGTKADSSRLGCEESADSPAAKRAKTATLGSCSMGEHMGTLSAAVPSASQQNHLQLQWGHAATAASRTQRYKAAQEVGKQLVQWQKPRRVLPAWRQAEASQARALLAAAEAAFKGSVADVVATQVQAGQPLAVLADGGVVLKTAEEVAPIITLFCPGFPRLISFTQETAGVLRDSSFESTTAQTQGFTNLIMASYQRTR